MTQNCHEGFSTNKISSQFYKVTIHPYGGNVIPNAIKFELRWQPIDKGIVSNEFQLFTNEYKEERQWERTDLLIPVDKKQSKILFLKCLYSLPSVTPTKMTGCGVTSDFEGRMYLRYSIKPEEIGNYKEIDQKIKSKLSEFMVE
ncbi:MAG: hypothetical protein DI586_00275 [Micavibrio aeruginosavorus]|uniref:Uncharacterized protein n=1 Tax=Micavibrio aeruginosavorus TaxID=349221 RepID=A0A2W5HH28_9BACT|nr:MAG: hypothetical protein DI586_00275 [Micavibrio aeruginosavorus]